MPNHDIQRHTHFVLSCKHLCCREGIDKAPKPPKNSFVSARSLVGPSSLAATTGPGKILASRERNPKSKFRGPDNGAKIEAVDLTNERDRYAKNRPTEFRKLNQLHESVTKGSSTPLIPRARPTSDFQGWDQTKISFLNRAATTEDSNDKPSTDYDGNGMGGLSPDSDWMGGLTHGRDHIGGLPADNNWMGGLPADDNWMAGLSSDGNEMGALAIDSNWTGDLPSASVLSQSEDTHPGPSYHDKSTDYGSDWQDDLPSLSALLDDNIPGDETPYKDNSLADLDLSQSDMDQADLEDAMIGFSDSVAIQNDSQAEAANTATNMRSEDQIHTFHEQPIQGTVAPEKSHALVEPSIFPDNLYKPIESTRKRKVLSNSEEEEVMLNAPVPKKAKTSKESNQAVQPSSNAENKAETSGPVIKPGQPAWVYEFDPAFIAEYQDFVEFV